jgi:hypothetical protein
MTTPTTKKEQLAATLEANLPHFTGSDGCASLSYAWLRTRFLLSDGAKYLAETAQAYWLMDAIASYQNYPRFRAEPDQVWELFVQLDKPHQVKPELETLSVLVQLWAKKAHPEAALLVCHNRSGSVLCKQEIPYTDFPLSQCTLFATRDEDGNFLVVLPQED